ncbi:MAG TPA: hypothetical protein EYP20_04960 [Aigarchaeota archaeon]|nr:hypothetical protein [Aigarchaeota archaeon]
MGNKVVLGRVDDVFLAFVVDRLSRVSVLAEAEGARFLCHLRNTGRLPDFIYEGAPILVQPRPRGRTHALLVGAPVEGGGAALLDTYMQSRYFEKALSVNAVSWFSGYSLLKRDVKVMDSRIDYLIRGGRGRRGYMELKSAVYLDHSDGYAMYPDTVSERGRRHVKLLAKLARRGGRVIITFLACHPRAVGLIGIGSFIGSIPSKSIARSLI